MLKKNRLGTVLEISLILLISATAGIAWNWTLLTEARRGEVRTGQAAAPAAAPEGEELPMPIGLPQVKEMHDAGQAVIVDARSAASFAQGHIAGAILLPLEQARRNPASPFQVKIPSDAVIIAYCSGFSCHDSIELGKLLIRSGYTAVYVYEGGFPEWRDAGYPIATGGT